MTDAASPGARPSPAVIEEALMRLVESCGPGRSISAMDVARALGGDRPEQWGPLATPVRTVAIALAKAGRVVILRKGRPVDPDALKGVYRIAPAGPAAGEP